MADNDSVQSFHVRSPVIGEIFTWERPINNPGILALIKPAPIPLWRTGLIDEDESEEEGANQSQKSDSNPILQLCDVSDDEYAEADEGDNDGVARHIGKTKGPRFPKFTSISEAASSPTAPSTTTDNAVSKHRSFTFIGGASSGRNLGNTKKRRFGLFHHQNHLSKDYAGPAEHLLPFHDMADNTGHLRKNGWLLFNAMANVPNPAVFKCKRFHVRRNAICDPLNLLMPQITREHTEREAVQRKNSIFRRIKIFFRVKLGIEGEEDL